MERMDRLLVVVAHGDDETLGAGATIARMADEGVEISLCVLTNDDSSRLASSSASRHEATNRIAMIQMAASVLGIKRVQVNAFGDNTLDTVGQLELNRIVEREVRDFEPDALFTTSLCDLSLDHRMVSRASRIAGRSGRGSVREIRCFEVRSATDRPVTFGAAPPFQPNCWQTLDESHFERKLDALRVYGTEVESWPSPRSERAVRALAEYRGSQVATGLAEAFELIKVVL